MDYKGHFATRAGRRHPLTVVDDHSRYAVGLRACGDERGGTVQAELTAIFRLLDARGDRGDLRIRVGPCIFRVRDQPIDRPPLDLVGRPRPLISHRRLARGRAHASALDLVRRPRFPYAKNARTHSDAQIAAIAASIKEWGWTTPALVGEDGGLIAGHARVLAARQLGIVEIPVMVAAGWTEAQKRAYVLADNQLAITGSGWDPELLRLNFIRVDPGIFRVWDQPIDRPALDLIRRPRPLISVASRACARPRETGEVLACRFEPKSPVGNSEICTI